MATETLEAQTVPESWARDSLSAPGTVYLLDLDSAEVFAQPLEEGSASTPRNRNTGTAQSITKNVASEPAKLLRPPVTTPVRRIKILQQWEGVVIEVLSDAIFAELNDLTVESNPVEFAEILVDDFSSFDHSMLEVGALFYWSIGYETKPSGQLTRISEMRVRRLPSLTKRQQKEIATQAASLASCFVSHDSIQSSKVGRD